MARILILDDGRSGSALLKLTLIRNRHDVDRTDRLETVMNPPLGRELDLILIRHAFENYSGWDVFNHLKGTFPRCAVMVFTLACMDSVGMARFIQAVEAGIDESRKFQCRHLPHSVASQTSIFREANFEKKASTQQTGP